MLRLNSAYLNYVGINCHFKQTIMIFRDKFAQKGYIPPKEGQMNIINEHSIFGLAWVPTFILNKQLSFYLTKFVQNGYSFF